MRSQGSDTRGILVFLLISFGLAWAVWGIAWLAGVFDTGATGQVVVALGASSLALATIVVRRWVTREGFADAGLRLSLRGKWPYYLFAWLIPLPVVGAIYLLASALGIQPKAEGGLPASLVLAAVTGSLVAAPIFWLEEFGWRGYLQLRLFRGSPLLAAVATGLIWGVFHYPVILVGYEGYENVYLGLLVFPIFTVLLSITFGWLRQRTGSVWSTCLAHSAANGIGGVLTAWLYAGGGSFLLASYAGVLGYVPLGLIALWIVLTGRLVAADAPTPGPRLAPR